MLKTDRRSIRESRILPKKEYLESILTFSRTLSAQALEDVLFLGINRVPLQKQELVCVLVASIPVLVADKNILRILPCTRHS